MSGKAWFRLYAEMPDDPKVGMLDDTTFRAWVTCLCFAAREGDSGRIGTMAEINWAARRDFTAHIEALDKAGLVTLRGDVFYVTRWRHRQFHSDSSAERTRKWRENKNPVTSKPDTPSQKRHGDGVCDGPEQSRAYTEQNKTPISPEGDLFGDEKKEGKQAAEKFTLPEGIPADLWKAWEEVRVKKRNPPTDTARKIAARKLLKLVAEGWPVERLMEEAIEKGWASFFPPKDDKPKPPGASPRGWRNVRQG